MPHACMAKKVYSVTAIISIPDVLSYPRPHFLKYLVTNLMVLYALTFCSTPYKLPSDVVVSYPRSHRVINSSKLRGPHRGPDNDGPNPAVHMSALSVRPSLDPDYSEAVFACSAPLLSSDGLVFEDLVGIDAAVRSGRGCSAGSTSFCCLHEMDGDDVVSLADNCYPFSPILLSDSERGMEDKPRLRRGRGVAARRGRAVATDVAGDLEEEYIGDDVISLDSDFGPFPPLLQLEARGETAGQDKQGIAGEVQRRRELPFDNEHGSLGEAIVNLSDYGTDPSGDVAVMMRGTGATTSRGHEDRCRLPRPSRERGEVARPLAVVALRERPPDCLGVVVNGRVARGPGHSRFKPKNVDPPTHALPLRLRLIDRTVPYSELLHLDPLPTLRTYKGSSKKTDARKEGGDFEECIVLS